VKKTFIFYASSGIFTDILLTGLDFFDKFIFFQP